VIGDRETTRTLFIVVAIALAFAAWGVLLFYTVGDKGPASWDFGVVRDVPGSSAYSTFDPAKALKPDTRKGELEIQHVEGKPGSAAP